MKKITFLLFFGLFLSNSCTVVDPELIELIQEINNQNKALLDQVKSLQAKSDSLIEELKKSDAKQAGLTERIINLQGELAKVLSQMNTINQQLQKQGADLIAINALLADLQKKYEEIVTQLTQLQRLSQILLEIESLKKQLTDLDGKYQVVATTLGQNQQALDALKTQIAALQTQMNQNITRINQLTTQLGEQGVDMDKVLAEIEALKKSTEELKAKIDEILKGKSPVPTTGLVAWYPFNGNANDESGKGNNGIVSGATLTTDRSGTTNTAYFFSSANCATRIDAQINTTSIQTALTISIWVMKAGNGCIGPRILEFWPGNNGPGLAQWGWDNSNGTRFGSITSTGREVESSFTPISNNTWTHLVYANDGSFGRFYQDGKLIKTVASSGNPILAGNASFGRMNHPAFDAFNGKLDDIGIWNRALTAQEITKIYNGEKF
jgi:predicted nuclease with TOPRIM domain